MVADSGWVIGVAATGSHWEPQMVHARRASDEEGATQQG